METSNPIENEPIPPTPNASERITRAFLRNPYPLSEAGLSLRQQAESVLATGDASMLDELGNSLPTVESPHLDLFADLKTTPAEDTEFFGKDLSDIQVTKGCSHKCDFCAAGATTSVQKMPFAGILKIAEKKVGLEGELERQEQQLRKDMLINIYNADPNFDPVKALAEHEDNNDSLWKSNPEMKLAPSFLMFLEERYPRIAEAYKTTYVNSEYSRNPASIKLSQKDLVGAIHTDYIPRHNYRNYSITNYYDSDPFDYQDSSFPHRDGTPADYGDVVKALASETRPIHITTAGWSRKNKIAQRAAEKIVAFSKRDRLRRINQPRISVNMYEQSAKRDYETYLADVQNAIQTLAGIPGGLEVLLFGDENDPTNKDFIVKVVHPIEQMQIQGVKISRPPVSLYSGPMAVENSADDHHDVMACMPGYHIWPDGSVNYQKPSSEIYQLEVAKGTRPTPIGKNIFPTS